MSLLRIAEITEAGETIRSEIYSNYSSIQKALLKEAAVNNGRLLFERDKAMLIEKHGNKEQIVIVFKPVVYIPKYTGKFFGFRAQYIAKKLNNYISLGSR